MGGDNSPIQDFMLWPVDSSAGLHKSLCSGQSLSASARYKAPEIPRRLAPSSTLFRKMPNPEENSSESVSRAGTQSKFKEIISNTSNNFHLSRDENRFKLLLGLPQGQKSGEIQKFGETVSGCSSNFEELRSPIRDDGLSDRSDPGVSAENALALK